MIRALLGGLLVWQGFQHWYLAIIGVAFWIWSLRAASVWRRLWRTTVYGVALYAPLLHWFAVLGHDAWVLMVVLSTLPLFVVAIPGARARPVTLAAAVVVAEWIHAQYPFGGFPWGLLAYSQVDGPLAWTARLGGQQLVSAMVVLVAAALAGRGSWASGRVGALALAATLAALAYALPVPSVGTIRVAAVQGGVPRPALAPAAQRAAVLDNHIRLTTAAHVADAALVVWPEDVVAGDPLHDPDVTRRISAAVQAVDRPVLVGGLVFDEAGAGPTNSALLWLPDAGMVHRYDKVHVVPFGEYLPYRAFLAQRIGRFDLVPVDMRPGTGPGLFDDVGERFGALICFEIAYDDHVRQLVRGGAQYIVVQSNNSTYLGTDQPAQQFAITRLRALGHARGVVVATTTGVSGVIDQNGAVVATAPQERPAVVTGAVPQVRHLTVADRLGDWVSPLGGVVLAGSLVRQRRRRQPANP